LLVFSRYYLDAVNFRNLQVLQEEDFEQQLERNQGKYSLTILILYSLPLVTHLHALIGLPIPYIPIGFGLWLVDLLGPTVMRVIQVFPSYMILSLACVFVRVFGLPSVEMWFDRGEDQCCDLSNVGMVETVGIRQVMWIVVLESAKDRILGVDILGQHVPPRVWYGTTCWLIRKALVILSCWKSGTGMAIPMRPQGARGAWGYSVVPNKGKPMAKQDIRAGVNLCKDM
jgi:hypothetical protein